MATDEPSVCELTEVTCTPLPPITWATRYGYLILAPISSYLSLLLIIGYFKFKSLRESPGDLILGMSASNFILTMYWFLSMLIPDINHGCGCYASGIVASFAGFINYVYNLAFLYYLHQKLRNLLTQARITKAYKLHFWCLLLSGLFIGFLIEQDMIGQNLFGTCSKIFVCINDYFTGTVVVVFYLIYEIISICLYYYIKSKFGYGVEQFVDNFRAYLLTSTGLWLLVAMGIAYSEYTTDAESTLTMTIVAISNICGVLQSVVLTFYRFRDPLIKKSMTQLIFFCKKRTDEKKDAASLETVVRNQGDISLAPNAPNTLNKSLMGASDSLVSMSSSSINIVEKFSIKMKSDQTYSVLSSIVLAYANLAESQASDLTLVEKINQTAVYDINESSVFETIANSQEEFKVAKCKMMPVKLYMTAPQLFKEMINGDFGTQQMLKSLDLHSNRRKIKEDNKGDGGKSGEFFFFSFDNKVLIKSIPDEEFNSLTRILKGYHNHLEKNPDSLITKIYGIFQFEWQYQPLNLIVMKSVCPYPKRYIERTYDMKGSTYDRQVLKAKQYQDSKLTRARTLKDSDFMQLEKTIKVSEEIKFKIMETVKEDLWFLWKSQLIDYSLVLFIVNKQKYLEDMKKVRSRSGEGWKESEMIWLHSIPNEEEPEMCYCIGIIDFLQTYTLQKMMEKNVKRIINFDPTLDTSAQDPTIYHERFKKFVGQILGFSNTSLLIKSDITYQNSSLNYSQNQSTIV